MSHSSNNYNSGNNNNRKTQRLKTTGIDFFERLSAEDRKLALAKAKRHWNSLSQAEKVDRLNLLYDMVREKMVRHSGIISHGDAVREFLSVDLPKSVQAAIEEAEHNGRLDIAADLRRRRFGVDTFEILLFDKDTGKPIL